MTDRLVPILCLALIGLGMAILLWRAARPWSRRTRRRIGIVVAVLVVLVGAYAFLGRPFGALSPEAAVARWCDRHLEPALDALERYRERHGRYPADLDPVAEALPKAWGRWPTHNGSHDRQVLYVPVEDGRGFILGCVAVYGSIGPITGRLRTGYVFHLTSPEGPLGEVPECDEWPFGWCDRFQGECGRWAFWCDRSGRPPYSDSWYTPWWYPRDWP